MKKALASSRGFFISLNPSFASRELGTKVKL